MNEYAQTLIDRSEAWHRLFLERTCPPPEVLAKGGILVERHLQSCLRCRRAMDACAELGRAGQALSDLARPLATSKSDPAPGDLRRLHPAGKGGENFDSEGRYHNPPRLLVLRIDGDGSCLVAQVFNEPALKDTGDVPLGGGSLGFAESWNVYSLPVGALSPFSRHNAGTKAVEAVLLASEGDCEPTIIDDAIRHFRQLELETAAFFGNECALMVPSAVGETLLEDQAQLLDTDLDAYLALLHGNWEDEVPQVALAAAPAKFEGCLGSGGEQFPIHCVLVERAAGGSSTRIIEAVMEVTHLTGKCRCTICADTGRKVEVTRVDLRCNGQPPINDVALDFDEGRNFLYIMAAFEGDLPDPASLQAIIVTD